MMISSKYLNVNGLILNISNSMFYNCFLSLLGVFLLTKVLSSEFAAVWRVEKWRCRRSSNPRPKLHVTAASELTTTSAPPPPEQLLCVTSVTSVTVVMNYTNM